MLRVREGFVPIPMAFRIFVQRGKHDGENNLDIVADEVAEILVVPEVESTLSNLKVRTGHRFG